MKEEWRPVAGYVGFYEVSSWGRVRSVRRTHTSRNRYGVMQRTLRGKVLTPGRVKDGYLAVTLSRHGKTRMFRIHRLVLTAFERPPKRNEEACHLNHMPSDNTFRNLMWGTRLENEQQKDAAGRRRGWYS